MSEITNWLKENGIEITIIPHDINKKFGSFNPKNYHLKCFKNDGCYIIKFSYPTIKDVCYSIDDFDGIDPIKYTGDKWNYSIKNWKDCKTWQEGYIKIGDNFYDEEILWWFSFGAEPTVEQALYNVFNDFCFLEEIFMCSNNEMDFDPCDTDDAIKLFKALQVEGEVTDWEELEKTLTVHEKTYKLYQRFREPWDIMFSEYSTGIGEEKFEELKQLSIEL